jgi:hypothetical protein
MWDSLIGEFSKANPNIAIRYQPIPGESWGDYFDKLATMIAGGNPPDVSRVAIEGARLVVSRGLAQPLDDFMKGDPEIDEYMKDVSPRLLEVFRVDGKTVRAALRLEQHGHVLQHQDAREGEAGGARRRSGRRTSSHDGRQADQADSVGRARGLRVRLRRPVLLWHDPWMFANGTNILSDDWTKSNLQGSEGAGGPAVHAGSRLEAQGLAEALRRPTPTSTRSWRRARSPWRAAAGWPVLQMTKAGFSDFDIQYFPRWKAQVTEYGVGGFVILKSTKYPAGSVEVGEVPHHEGRARDPDQGRPGHSRAALGGGQPRDVRAAAEERQDLLRVDRGSERQARALARDLQPDRGDVAPLPRSRLANEMAPAAALEEADKEFTTILASR